VAAATLRPLDGRGAGAVCSRGGSSAEWGRASVRARGCARVDVVASRGGHAGGDTSRAVRDRCLSFLRAQWHRGGTGKLPGSVGDRHGTECRRVPQRHRIREQLRLDLARPSASESLAQQVQHFLSCLARRMLGLHDMSNDRKVGPFFAGDAGDVVEPAVNVLLEDLCPLQRSIRC